MLKNQFLNKLNEDIFHQVEKVRILALSTIPQLDGHSFDNDEDYDVLLQTMKKATKSHSQDVRFLARKALNHLENITPGEDSTPEPAFVPQEADAQGTRPAPIHVALANSQAFNLCQTMEESSPAMDDHQSSAPAMDDHQSSAPATDEQQSVEDVNISERENLIESIKEESDPNELCVLIAKLSECAITEDIRLVARFIKHQDSRVRSNTVEFLSIHAPHKIQLKLITPLMEDPDNRVKGNVAKALAQLGEESVITYVSALLDDPKMANRESAVYALSNFPDGEKVKDLLYRALTDSYDGVKLRAIRALASVGSYDAIPHLKVLLSDDNPALCEAAGQAIREINPDADLNYLAVDSYVDSPESAEELDPAEAALMELPSEVELEEAAHTFEEPDTYEAEAPAVDAPEPKDENGVPKSLLALDAASFSGDIGLHVEEESEVPEPPVETYDSAEDDDEIPLPRRVTDPPVERAENQEAAPAKKSSPPKSKAAILAQMDKAADNLLGTTGEYIGSVKKKMQGLKKEGLQSLLEHELCSIAEKVFKEVRTGALNSNDLNQPYYDILKYADFKAKQLERLSQKETEVAEEGFFSSLGRKLGIVKAEENSAKEALDRLDKKITQAKVELAIQAVKLIRSDSIELDDSADMVTVIDMIKEAIKG